jgi:hypothetical protein
MSGLALVRRDCAYKGVEDFERGIALTWIQIFRLCYAAFQTISRQAGGSSGTSMERLGADQLSSLGSTGDNRPTRVAVDTGESAAKRTLQFHLLKGRRHPWAWSGMLRGGLSLDFDFMLFHGILP